MSMASAWCLFLKVDKIADRPLFWHYPHYGNQGGEPSAIIRKGDWKLIHYYEDGNDELYQLSKDIGEQNNLATVKPELAQNSAQRARCLAQANGSPHPTTRQTLQPCGKEKIP